VLRLGLGGRGPLRILCVGAHSDDIEIGCGGTLLHLLRERGDVRVAWVVLGATGERVAEAERSAADFLARAAETDVRIFGFEDSFFPYQGAAIKREFQKLKDTTPDVVFTHFRGDLHQDHRLVSELTWNAFRDHLILEYEIPKYDGDLVPPNAFVPLDLETCREKVRLVEKHFATQSVKPWFDEALFLGLMRMRGVESRSPTGYAEGFHARKVVL